MNKLFFSLLLLLIGSAMYGQDKNIIGLWDTGQQGTIIEVSGSDGALVGKITSSDNPKVKMGTVLLKNFNHSKGLWNVALYSMKRKEWYDGVLKLRGNVLEIEITSGWIKKKISWRRYKNS